MESVSVVSKRRSVIGEGPHWDPRINKLIYVDIEQGTLCRLDPLHGTEEAFQLENHAVTLAIPYSSDPNFILISCDKRLLKLNWNTKETSLLAEVEPDISTRFNDGKCDFAGRLWAGTMGFEISPGVFEEGVGSLYSMDSSLCVFKHLSGLSISNGLAWSRDNKTFFFVDSSPKTIYAFDYDIISGTITNQRVLVDFNKNLIFSDCGLPDGITLDIEGKLWVACYNGGQILRLDPETGELLRRVKLPTKRITSCCFGGPNYSDLYVTSAYRGFDREEMAQQPAAGAVFKISNLGVTGFEANSFLN